MSAAVVPLLGATSFNTSGDAYSLQRANVNIPPEESAKPRVGAKLDSADKRFTTRLAIFRATKLHERNTDPLVNLVTLSGKRHVAGFEIDVTGRLTPRVGGLWLLHVDAGGQHRRGALASRPGQRPSLTPVHSGTVWTTYQITPQWRVGGGLNFRSADAQPQPRLDGAGLRDADLMAEYTISELTAQGSTSATWPTSCMPTRCTRPLHSRAQAACSSALTST
jgi:catecholate siderophore receptor